MKTNIVLTLALVICVHAGLVISEFSVGDENAIRNNTALAPGYNALIRPAATTEVNIGLSLFSVDELDLNNHIFGASGWMIVKWMDARLAWDPATYGGIETVVVPRIHIWKPDLALDSLFEDHNSFTDDSSNVRYDFTGKVVWQQWRNFKLYCKIGKDYFPGEEQTCTLDVVGSSYNISEVNLGFLSTAIDIEYIREAADFKVTETGEVSSTVAVKVDNETSFEYPKLEFRITIKRGYRTLIAFMIPLMFTLLLMSFTFLIPFESGEKLSYILSIYMSTTFLLTILSDELPPEYIARSNILLFPVILMMAGAEVIAFTVLLYKVYPQKESNITLSDLKHHSFIITFGMCLSSKLRRKIKDVRDFHPSDSLTNRTTREGSEVTTENIIVTQRINTENLTTAKEILQDAIYYIEWFLYFFFVLQSWLYLFYVYLDAHGAFFNDERVLYK